MADTTNAKAPPANLEQRIHWTEEAKSRVETRVPPVNLEWPVAKLAAVWKETFANKETYSKQNAVEDLRHGWAKMTPQAQAIAERMITFYAEGKEPTELDALADAATFGILSVEAVAPYLLRRGGAKFFADVLLASYNVTVGSYGGQGGSGRHIEIDPAKGSYIIFAVARWMRLALSEKEQAEARPTLEQARAAAPLELRLAITLASGDRNWAMDDATEVLAQKKATLRYDAPRHLLATLRDPDLLSKFAQKHPNDIPVYDLIQDLGFAAAPAVAHVVEKNPSNDWHCEAAAVLECITSAKVLAQSLAKKGGGAAARSFYKRRPDLAFVALAPIVAAEGKIAPFVKPELDAILKSHPDFPNTLAEHLDAKTRNVFAKQEEAKQAPPRKIATMGDVPRALQAWPEPRKGKKVRELPDFADSSKLPAVLLPGGEAALPESAGDNLLARLMQSTLEDPDSEIKVIKKACDAKSLNAFTWALFEAWLAAGANSKEGWAFTALGHFGTDETARRLTPLIRAWPGESQHARAVTGCGILAAIGTDVALMHLHGIAQKVKFKGLQQRAQLKIAEIAQARNLTAEELADRLVPDLGLDETGSMVLDLGARQFKVGFDHVLKPFVLDANNKKVSDLPKAGKSDDSDLAASAHEKWKALKKDAKTIAAAQIARFEMAMCSQRRWSGDDFKTFIVDHPLVVHIARRVVFGVFDAKTNKLTQTFRVSEDRSYANDKDESLAPLKTGEVIGIVHRLEVDDALLLARWGEILGEYEIIQPFDQLGRAVFKPTAEEEKSALLARMKGVTVKTGKILGLEHRGWRKGPPQDAGWVWNMVKPVAGGFEADLGISGGICMGYMEGTPSEQELGGLDLSSRGGHKEVKLGDLSPTAFSELVRDLEMLRE